MEDIIRFTVVTLFALGVLWQSFKIANAKKDSNDDTKYN